MCFRAWGLQGRLQAVRLLHGPCTPRGKENKDSIRRWQKVCQQVPVSCRSHCPKLACLLRHVGPQTRGVSLPPTFGSRPSLPVRGVPSRGHCSSPSTRHYDQVLRPGLSTNPLLTRWHSRCFLCLCRNLLPLSHHSLDSEPIPTSVTSS